MFAIPAPILQAIVLNESGDNPLALNVGGQPVYPSNRGEALSILRRHQGGKVNVDAGCGQISMKHHAAFFAKAPEMSLDPWLNVVYMAREIKAAHRRTGNWAKAVAVYHSPTPERQRDYLCKAADKVLRLNKDNTRLKDCPAGKGR